MLIPLPDLILMGIGAVLLIIWLIIFVASRKYDQIFVGLDEEEFRLKDIYSMGYAVMTLIKYQYTGDRDRKFRQQIDILYDKNYTEFYLRVIYARAVTYGMLIVVASFALYGFTSERLIVPIGVVYGGIAIYTFMNSTQKKIEQRSAALIKDFSEAVSKLAILTRAGLILREAWKTTAEHGEGIFYDEMRLALVDMENGVSDMEAIRRFGNRCVLPDIKRFSATVVQGMQKGPSELSDMLEAQSSEVWNMRKQVARREGEKAATKLLAPMVLMFIGIIIMIVVPIFANIGA